MAKYRSWPFSVSEDDMTKIDKACADLGEAIGAKVSRSEFLRLCAGAAASVSFGQSMIATLTQMHRIVQDAEQITRKAADSVKESLSGLSADDLAAISEQIAKMKAKP